mmetsp:Transcript_135869/g.260903  ORF Transcript_135869/g.260903 Transcript_135869/m.260903 type:complete len:133 (+) Transcript_135869:262-660(+)
MSVMNTEHVTIDIGLNCDSVSLDRKTSSNGTSQSSKNKQRRKSVFHKNLPVLRGLSQDRAPEFDESVVMRRGASAAACEQEILEPRFPMFSAPDVQKLWVHESCTNEESVESTSVCSAVPDESILVTGDPAE